jgi:hypothetical protein
MPACAIETKNFSLIPNGNYKYWEIITTNAAPSFFSNMRQYIRGGVKTKKNKLA